MELFATYWLGVLAVAWALDEADMHPLSAVLFGLLWPLLTFIVLACLIEDTVRGGRK